MNARELSLKILEDVWYNEAYSNISLNRNIEKYRADKDEAFIRELVYGVLENQLYLDYVIDKLSKVKRNRIHKNILTILRLGIYQIQFMDGVPDRAAVNESVELAKKYGNRGSIGYVNGILRNVSRKKKQLWKIDGLSRKEKISIRYSHPLDLVENWIDEFGIDFTEDLCRANNDLADFNIRLNSLKTDKKSLIDLLGKESYNVVESEYANNSLSIKNPSNIFKTDLYKEGYFSVQDESSSILGEIINPESNSLILDSCAAPGGKSTAMAESMGNSGRILSRDIHQHRLNLIDQAADRLGIDIIETSIFDAKVLDKELIGKLDYCLVDAPCSGLGTIRRSPEIRYKRDMKDMEDLSNLQLDILNTVKDYIKEDGQLFYSTCTIGSIENDRVIDRFLEKNKDFKLEKLDYKGLADERGFIKLYPNLHGTDGFFICKLVKSV